jgi:RND family efflux transporter MFP subunit
MDIQKGMEVEVRTDALPEKSIKGTVTIVSPTINPASRTGEIEIHIPNPGRLLRAGMFARVKLFLGRKTATAIPREAMMKIPGTGGYFVYTAENGIAVQKNIETGIRQGNFIEVISGVSPGDSVIVAGQNRVRDGLHIAVQ